MAKEKPELDKIVIDFKKRRETDRTFLFDEQLGERQWSDQDVAVGSLYVKKQALELIGMPEHIRVTIEPIK